MAQIPALFLPKKKIEEKPQVKNSNKKSEEKETRFRQKSFSIISKGN